MLLKLKLLTALLLFSPALFSQSKIPKSYVNAGLGVGTNYGGLGIKTVLGYKNSGLLLGLGWVPSSDLGYSIGGQFSCRSFYTNITYSSHTIDRSEKSNNYAILTAGAMIGLGKQKRVFIDLGLSTGIKILSNNLFLGGQAGVGYRLGGKKK